MYYIISKLCYFLFEPSTIIILLLLYCIRLCETRKLKQAIFVAIGFVYLFSNEFIFDVIAGKWESQYMQTVVESDNLVYEAGIVMGGISRRQPHSEEIQFSRAGDRLFQAIKLYKEGKVKRIIFSGGSGNLYQPEIKEGEYIRKYLQQIGMPDSSFIIESVSDNTYQSAVNMAQLIKRLGLSNSKILLITSACHMRRSMACFKKQNIDNMIPYATDFYSGKLRFEFEHCFLPETITMANYYVILHEIIGYTIYKLLGYC